MDEYTSSNQKISTDIKYDFNKINEEYSIIEKYYNDYKLVNKSKKLFDSTDRLIEVCEFNKKDGSEYKIMTYTYKENCIEEIYYSNDLYKNIIVSKKIYKTEKNSDTTTTNQINYYTKDNGKTYTEADSVIVQSIYDINSILTEKKVLDSKRNVYRFAKYYYGKWYN